MSFYDFSFALASLSPLLLVLGIVSGFFLYKKLDTIHKGIFYYLIVMLIIDLLSRFLWRYGNNHIVLLVYSFIEVVGISYFYYRFLLERNYILPIVATIMAAGYITWELIDYSFFDTDIKYFQPYAKVADNFVIIVLALTFLYEKMNSFKESKWKNFRLNIIILVFFTLNTLIFLPFNFLVNETSGVKFYFWTGNIVLLLLFYSFLIIEMLKNARKKM